MPPVAADADAVHRPELVRLGVGGIHRRLSPVLDEFAVRVELRHARAGIAVGHEERAVGQPGDVRRAVEVVRAPPRHAALAHRLQQLAVVAEDHDLVHVVVDDPDALFRVVRVHQDLVRPAAHLAESRAARRREVVVVLQPLLDRLAVAIDREHQVVPALLVEVGLAGVVAPAGIRPAGVHQAGARPRLGARRQLDLAALRDPDLVRAFGPDARARSPRPAGMREIGVGQRLRPGDDRLVVAHVDLADRLLALCFRADRQRPDERKRNQHQSSRGKYS